MEAQLPRRRETLTSLQLQRASDQLQEAIASARQRRSVYNTSSHATSLSLLSDVSDEEDDENANNHENQALHANQSFVSNDPIKVEKLTPDMKLRRFMADSMGSSGRRMSLKELLATPLQPPRKQHVDDFQWPQQLAGEDERGGNMLKEQSGNCAVVSTAKRVFEDERMEHEARIALEALQQQVEAQAKNNRAIQEQLKQVICRIHEFVEHVVNRNIPNCVDEHKTVDLLMMEQLGGEWTTVLDKWKDGMDEIKCSAEERIAQFQEEMETLLHTREIEYRRQQEVAENKLSLTIKECANLLGKVEALEQANKEENDKHSAMLDSHQLTINRMEMEIEDWRMQLLRHTETAQNTTDMSSDTQKRYELDLLAQLKQSELRELQWEMLFEEQSQATLQAEERLCMLLEDVNCSKSHVSPTPAVPAPSLNFRNSRFLRADSSASLATSTASSELHIYQQRIELLEEELKDVKEQIHCDHHQFLYEQQKWDLEKKHMGHDVEEVHSVSLKVLKMLLLREKLLKKQEKKSQRRLDKVKEEEDSIRAKQDAIHTCLEAILQECGAALLYVRQLALASATQPLPVKPIKLVRVIKRLKTLQQDCAIGLDSTESSFQPPPVSSTRTKGVHSAEYHCLAHRHSERS